MGLPSHVPSMLSQPHDEAHGMLSGNGNILSGHSHTLQHPVNNVIQSSEIMNASPYPLSQESNIWHTGNHYPPPPGNSIATNEDPSCRNDTKDLPDVPCDNQTMVLPTVPRDDETKVIPTVPRDNETMVGTCVSQTLTSSIQEATQKTPKFICPTCGISVQSNCALKVHIATVHTSQKRFQCLDCQKCYKSRSSLIVHHNSHGHGPARKPNDPNICLCENCGASFHGITLLKRHRKQYAEKGLSCAKHLHVGDGSALSEKKSTAGRPKRIINNPVYGENEARPSCICHYCGLYFYELSALHQHKLDVHGVRTRATQRFKCQHCCKSFALKV